MAEGFEIVSIVRHHLRRSAALLDEGKFDEALVEADSALAVDPQSAAAQALRDRIRAAKAAATGSTVRSESQQTSRSFVPYGVNAASWRGFEQRITERRFRALLETINTSIVTGDGAAARAALEEARELQPDSPVLADFEARVAAVPLAPPVGAGKPPARIWMRAMGAAALFLVGVSLLLGLEWLRPGTETTAAPPVPVVAPEVPAAAPQPDVPPEPSPDLGPVPVALNDEEESVPAVVTPPEPLLRPTATSGSSAPPQTMAARTGTTPGPLTASNVPPPVVERAVERAPAPQDSEPSAPLGEVSDDFVATGPTRTAAIEPDAGPAVAPQRPVLDTPVTADARSDLAPTPAVASAVSVPTTLQHQMRVEDVLRQYARAYAQLDARAARAVWPTVNERALARAFRDVASQNVRFDDCEIDIRGASANALCRGTASYVPKVGNREQRTEERSWRFELRLDGDAWQIVDVNASRQSSLDSSR